MSEWIWMAVVGAATFAWGWRAGRAAMARGLAMALVADPLCLTRLVLERAEAQRKAGDDA